MAISTRKLDGFHRRDGAPYRKFIDISPWVRAQVLWDEHMLFDTDAANPIINNLLIAHYLDIAEEPRREEMERKAYQARDSGTSWVGAARAAGIPYRPIDAQILAMCYAYRPMLCGRRNLPWPI